jgi:predicted ArsR family transcriptional regulator
MNADLTIPDQRMLELIDRLTAAGIIRFRQEFLDVVGFPKQNFVRVEQGRQHFSPEQIARACETYRINANWILGLEDQVAAGKRRISAGKQNH